MDYFTNHWVTLGDAAKQIIIMCGAIMAVTFYVMVRLLAEYDRFKYGSDDDEDAEVED